MHPRKTRFLLAVFLPPLIVACESHDSATLVGTWITESCEEGTTFDIPGEYWERGVFKFTSNGELEVGKNLYLDSSCETLDTEIPPGLSGDSTRITFEELGEDGRSKEKGTQGFRIALKSDSFSVSVEGLYLIEGDRACFSETIRFRTSSIENDQLGDPTRLNLEECLLRYE